MQAIFLLNDRRFRRNIDALLRTFGIAELAADTGVCDKITLLHFLCAAKSKAGTLNRLFGQVKPFSAAFIDDKDSQCASGRRRGAIHGVHGDFRRNHEAGSVSAG